MCCPRGQSSANRVNDFAAIPADDWRWMPKRLLNGYVDKLMAAAADDIVLTETFVRTLHLIEPPGRPMRPSMLMHIINGHHRHAIAPAVGVRP